MANIYLFCLVALFCCTGLSFARHVDDCSQGPSVWCQSLSTSIQCNATHLCATNLWNKMMVPKGNNMFCDICTTVVQEAHDVMANQNIQGIVKKIIEMPCQLFPALAEGCISVVDQVVPNGMNIIASLMDPQQVCSFVRLCRSAKIDRLM